MANKGKLLQQAQKHLTKGNLDRAIKCFNQLVELEPSNHRMVLRLADLLARAGRKQDAVKQYEKVAELYIKDDFLPRAIAVYRTVLRIDPELLSAYESLSELYRRQGLEGEALAQLQSLFEMYEKKGDEGKQIETLRLMAQMDPENLGFQVRLGETLAKQDNKKEAAEAFAHAATTLSKRGFHDRASELFEQIISLDPGNVSVRKELCSHYLESGHFEEAKKEIEAILEFEPDDPRMILLLGRILFKLDNVNEAEKMIARSLKVFSEMGDLSTVMREYLFVARTHLQNGELNEAEVFYRRIMDVAPNETQAQEGLASVAGSRGDTAVQIEILLDLARSLAGTDDQSGAARVYRQVLEIDPLLDEAKTFLEQMPEEGDEQALTQVPEGGLTEPDISQAGVEEEIPADEIELLDDDEAKQLVESEDVLDLADLEEISPEIEIEEVEEESFEVLDVQQDDELPEIVLEESELEVDPVPGDHPTVESEGADAVPEFDVEEVSFEGISVDEDVAEDIVLLEAEPEKEGSAEETPEVGMILQDPEPVEETVEEKPEEEPEEEPEKEMILQDPEPGGKAPDEASEEEVQAEPEVVTEVSLEDTLIEADVYHRYGLHEKVQEILTDLNMSYPGNVQVLEKTLEITMDVSPEKAPAIGRDLIKTLNEQGEHSHSAQIYAKIAGVMPDSPEARELASLVQDPGSEPEIFEEAAPDIGDLLSLEGDEEPQLIEQEVEADTSGAVESDDPFAEDMEEAQFFISQGLLEDAEGVLNSILEKSPQYEPATQALQSLQTPADPMAVETDMESVLDILPEELSVPEEPDPEEPIVEDKPPEEFKSKLTVEDSSPDTDGFLDLADELRSELAEEFDAAPEPAPTQEAPVTFEEIFAQFKKGIAETLGSQEYETHYNLGIAYKDMGLIDDAIRELEIASGDDNLLHDSLSLIAMCFMEKQDHDSAVKTVQKALETAREDHIPGLTYQLGQIYEKQGVWDKALESYEKVRDLDSGFQEAGEAIERVKEMSSSTPVEPDPVPEEGGLDDILSDLIKEVEEMAKEDATDKSPGKDDEPPPKSKKDRVSYI